MNRRPRRRPKRSRRARRGRRVDPRRERWLLRNFAQQEADRERRARRRLRARTVVLVAVVAGLVRLLFLVGDVEAGRAVGALYSSSAYAAASEPGVLDLPRVRQVIGDRPIVAAVLPPGGKLLDRCNTVAGAHPDVVAVVYLGAEGPAVCAGPDFPRPVTADGDPDRWLYGVNLDTEYSSQYRIDPDARERTAQVEEFVLAFDAAVPAAYPDGVPRREPAASPQVWWAAAVQLTALVAAVGAVFLLLRLLADRLLAWRADRRVVRERRLEQFGRVARLADAVIADPPAADAATARERAAAAAGYVLVLGEVERARDAAALDVTEERLGELEDVLLDRAVR